ncbi:alpha/beta fold hydrolase [Aspergillus saccharolyticus JOP 1030-1]|uniref:Alpha/beta-hydrolase n=1 Tax=Aspergillus saccharolyticus JOP 1030-1 TaxID=1450539 RepID=A0A318ZCS7_9EURO|nr:alpha/beta-hydrolase [Aspergillus saccharolyticus JOP 1030-1]PYH42443.1 alpha/beta-hydrolase [Aspergillus saccharolyticus JOP 1030-1]
MSRYQFISLATKPSAQLCYSFYPAVGAANSCLVVFVNGLGLPQSSWEGVIERLQAQPPASGLPAMLTYDRYGQGQTTDRDPGDIRAEDPMHGHDTLTVVRDLHQLLTQIASDKMGTELSRLPLVVVSNSIGGALARLYAQEHPGTVAGLLFLDSVLANSDFVSIYPDPDASGFDLASLPEGVTADALRAARAYMQRFEAFEVEFERMGGAPPRLTEVYMNPYWHRFNEGLAQLTEPERSKGPLQAPGAGHFIQKDNPDIVCNEIREILERIS